MEHVTHVGRRGEQAIDAADAVDQIVGSRDPSQPFDGGRSEQPVDAGLRHEHRHCSWTDLHAHGEGELGVDPPVAVGAARSDVDLTDQPGQPLAAQLCRCSRGPLVLVVVLPGDAEDPAASVHRRPGVDESVDRRAFWAELVLTEELRGLPDDREFAFEFVYPPTRGTQLGRLGRGRAGPNAPVDLVLAQPLRQRHRVNAQLDGRLLGLLAGTHQRDRSRTELRRVGTRHDAQPFVKAAS